MIWNFCEECKACVSIWFLIYVRMSSFSSIICWRDYLCFIGLSSLLCQRLLDCKCGSISRIYCSPLCSTDLSILSTTPHSIDYCIFTVRFKVLLLVWFLKESFVSQSIFVSFFCKVRSSLTTWEVPGQFFSPRREWKDPATGRGILVLCSSIWQ